MRAVRYNNGGKQQGNPSPPDFIQNDPNFRNVRFVGKNPGHEGRGRMAPDFRYDAQGVKFYGFHDDGLEFVDKDGNAFIAERRSNDGQDMFKYLQNTYGAQYSDEYGMATEGSTDRQGFPAANTGDLLFNLSMENSRDAQGNIVSGPSAQQRDARFRQNQQHTFVGGGAMHQLKKRGLKDMFGR